MSFARKPEIRLFRNSHPVFQQPICQRGVQQQAVDEIQNAADAGNDVPGIFDRQVAFEQRFDEVGQNGSPGEADGKDATFYKRKRQMF